jgi:3-hydroxyacyl-CoA dehydrogenase
MNRERVLSDAKARASNWFAPDTSRPSCAPTFPLPARTFWPRSNGRPHHAPGEASSAITKQKLGTKIAEVLCGGNITPGTPVSEQYVLDLEREAFKSLCGEKKTQERIQFTLKTGKTLRNWAKAQGKHRACAGFRCVERSEDSREQ